MLCLKLKLQKLNKIFFKLWLKYIKSIGQLKIIVVCLLNSMYLNLSFAIQSSHPTLIVNKNNKPYEKTSKNKNTTCWTLLNFCCSPLWFDVFLFERFHIKFTPAVYYQVIQTITKLIQNLVNRLDELRGEGVQKSVQQCPNTSIYIRLLDSLIFYFFVLIVGIKYIEKLKISCKILYCRSVADKLLLHNFDKRYFYSKTTR